MSQYDIFISYRREGGDMTAHVLYEELQKRGFSVFQDVESLRSGKFNEALYQVIEESKYLVLILSPGALDRCSEKEDWVRKEILHAMNHHVEIIPILLRGFRWPDIMPNGLEGLENYSGLEASTKYFNQFVDDLTRFLENAPRYEKKTENKKTSRSIRVITETLAAIVFLLFPVFLMLLHVPFTLWMRLVYCGGATGIALFLLHVIETRPEIAARCFGTLTEQDIQNPPDVVYSRISSVFGKGLLLSDEPVEGFDSYYKMKEIEFGSWDKRRVNYLRLELKRVLEWYDPTIFYLHTLSHGGQAVQMLTRQGFILKKTLPILPEGTDYLQKGDIHVFLRYKRRWLSTVTVYQCTQSEFEQYIDIMGV